ncbi:uncharacterized protein K489DRAFT_39090 [Dissoconium aciculare CBS 342.82]|uniref:Uncharacterized protein n=1 Tax=Dissoconium aciculare CBS 342.82 TaxID=1314786 RepID=A0A6J3LYC8_9PEZI|nr:uncharacterized protein K489DRAFT_39090 [Dissoconium aciculare CBS 342.82]KAF1820653.1 hypothetical protein K489DRAFT_39090 [Dissoconium aciculare CBS 342.82]
MPEVQVQPRSATAMPVEFSESPARVLHGRPRRPCLDPKPKEKMPHKPPYRVHIGERENERIDRRVNILDDTSSIKLMSMVKFACAERFFDNIPAFYVNCISFQRLHLTCPRCGIYLGFQKTALSLRNLCERRVNPCHWRMVKSRETRHAPPECYPLRL